MLQLDPRYHIVRKAGTITDWLAREFPRRNLFTFWNESAGVWEIGEWIAGNTLQEQCIIGPTLGLFTRKMANDLRYDLHQSNAWMRQLGGHIKSQLRYENSEQKDAFKDFQARCKLYVRKHPHSAPQEAQAFAGTLGAA